MDWPQLVATVVLVSASGALAPGPLLVATLSESVKRGARVGLLSATGHMIVELPLVLLIAHGIAFLLTGEATARLVITAAGVAALTFFGLNQLRESILAPPSPHNSESAKTPRNGVMIGIIFTGLNPYFITWWLTIGAKLVYDSIALAAWLGIAVMYASHIWIDYAWLFFTSNLAWRGGKILGSRLLRLVNLVLGAFLIVLALLMSVDLVSTIFSLDIQ
ncbi:MAG: LysE family transporter [Nitrososphaerota archaeon]